MPAADLLLALLLAVATAASRVPYRAGYLPTWDAVQFALALRDYDIVRQQPHAPGYILYVGAGRALDAWLHDPAASLTWLSVGASGATVALLFCLGRALYDRTTAVVAALVLSASPLFWLYGEVPLPYTVEAALATAVALLVWPLRHGRIPGLVGSALALAVAGGVRQSLLVVLGPLWVAMAWAGFRRWRPVLAGLALMAAAGALWLLPMLYLTGGLGRYLWAARELYESTVRATTIVAAGGEWRGNVRALVESLLMGLGLLLPLLVVVGARGLLAIRRWEAREWFLVAWVVPPLVVYVTVHFGQYGYILTVLPAFSLVVARALVGWARGGRDGAARRRGALVAAFVALAVVGHAGYFIRAEPVDVPDASAAASPWARRAAALRAFYRHRLWAHTARGLSETDQVVATYVGAIRQRFDPRLTVLVTELGNPRSYPWFRHATYYLPEFPVVHLRLGRFSRGYLSSRHLDTMETRPGPEVPLPPGARRLVWMADYWNPLLPKPWGLREIALPYGRWLYVLDVDGGLVLHGGYRLAPRSPAAGARHPPRLALARGAG